MKAISNADVSSCCFKELSVLIECLLLIVSPNFDTIWTTYGPEFSHVINEESSVQFRSWFAPPRFLITLLLWSWTRLMPILLSCFPVFWKLKISFQSFSIKIRHSIILWSRSFRHCNEVVWKDRCMCIMKDFLQF